MLSEKKKNTYTSLIEGSGLLTFPADVRPMGCLQKRGGVLAIGSHNKPTTYSGQEQR